jgi:hypothetical protein
MADTQVNRLQHELTNLDRSMNNKSNGTASATIHSKMKNKYPSEENVSRVNKNRKNDFTEGKERKIYNVNASNNNNNNKDMYNFFNAQLVIQDNPKDQKVTKPTNALDHESSSADKEKETSGDSNKYLKNNKSSKSRSNSKLKRHKSENNLNTRNVLNQSKTDSHKNETRKNASACETEYHYINKAGLNEDKKKVLKNSHLFNLQRILTNYTF